LPESRARTVHFGASVKIIDMNQFFRQAGAMRGMFSPATVVTAIGTHREPRFLLDVGDPATIRPGPNAKRQSCSKPKRSHSQTDS
jgi:hypothetical protein